MTYLRALPAADFKTILKAFPDHGRPLALYHEAVMRGPSPLTPAERELIAAYVSGLNGCQLCHAEHTGVAEALGAPSQIVAALLRDIAAAPVPERLKPILHLARKLTLTPSDVSASDVEPVFTAGWDDTALYHAVSVCALFNLDNRLVAGLAVPVPDPPDLARTVRRLAEHGYGSTLRYIEGDWPSHDA
jgi:uncharacterized peroxidase-related enzyme